MTWDRTPCSALEPARFADARHAEAALRSFMASTVLLTAGHCRRGTDRFTREGVAFGACELALQIGEGSNDVGRFEGSVAATDGHLLQDARFGETCDGFVRVDEAPSDEVRRAADRDDGGADEEPQEKVSRRTGTDPPQVFSPFRLDCLCPTLE